MSAMYKTTERDRDWETGSSRPAGGGGYTTVRRYKAPDHSLEEDMYETEMQMVHRGRNDFEERRSTKEYLVERDAPPPPRSEYRYMERSPSPRGRHVHEYRIERHVERSPSPARHQEIRISRDYERHVELERPREQPYDLERYSRSTEYFRPEPQPLPLPQPIYIRNEAPAAPPAPQPIIIREEPQTIIIRERAPEPAYELVERQEITEDRQVARPRPEEDYYYERRVKEVDRGGRREERYMDEREYGRDRYGERNYYSDDDVYIHKEKDTWGSETNAKRDVAAGALAGIAAGQLVRHHRKRKGEAPGGSIGNALGYGTLGAVSAVALDRFNNRDRSRSMSSERGRGRRDRHRSRSRAKEIGTLAALAGVGALAYAVGQRQKKKNEQVTTVIEKTHRSRSRSRRGRRRSKSVTVIESEKGRSRSRSKHGSRSRSKHTDPEHRNNRAAHVGLASAAVAGLVERRRSKSRKREGKRSPSRVRKGVPIAAAGVTGAAVAGLYEKHKAKKEVRAASKSRSRSRPRSVMDRLRGRSHSRPRSTHSEPVLVEYGGDPIYTDRARSRAHRQRRRSSSSSSRGRHGSRNRSRSRSRSKSRARSVAETAAVAGVAGLAAHEAAKRRDKKKADTERERRREDDSAYSTGTYSPSPYDSPQPSTAHPNDSRFFPETNYFPPPPNAPVDHNPNAPYPPYNPADYHPAPHSAYDPQHPSHFVNQAPPPHEDINFGNPYAPSPQQHHDPYYNNARRGHPDDNVSAPAPDRFTHAQTHANAAEHSTSIARGASRSMPGPGVRNVTDARTDCVIDDAESSIEAPSSRTAKSEKTVQFDLEPQEQEIPRDPPEPEPMSERERERGKRRNHHDYDEEEEERIDGDGDKDGGKDNDSHRRHRHHHRRRRRHDDNHSNVSKESGRDRKRHQRAQSPDSDAASDTTIELPPRFDEQGRKRPEDPLADKLESVLLGLFR